MPAVARHRQPIVNAAVSLFRRQGYTGTGVADIVDESGAPKGSLYHYFPDGKSAIAAAAIAEAGQRVAATLTELARELPTTAGLLRAHARLLAGWMRASNFRDGCPITTVLLELAPEDRAVSAAGRTAYRARIGILRDKLIADGFTAQRADRLALLCASALQGALIQARAEKSGTAIETTADELARMLEMAQAEERRR